MLSMAGKVAIVSGAGQVGPVDGKVWGNGKATATLLARRRLYSLRFVDPGSTERNGDLHGRP